MFINCNGLISLDLSGFDTRNVEYMDAMFESCPSLAELIISRDFQIGRDIASAPESMFTKCPIKSLDDCVVLD